MASAQGAADRAADSVHGDRRGGRRAVPHARGRDHLSADSIRGDLDRDLHLKIAQIADNPLILSVLNASAQLIENMITGIRSHFMQKNEDSPEIDSQHTQLVNAIINKNAPLAEKIMNEHMHTIERLLNEITAVHTK